MRLNNIIQVQRVLQIQTCPSDTKVSFRYKGTLQAHKKHLSEAQKKLCTHFLYIISITQSKFVSIFIYFMHTMCLKLCACLEEKDSVILNFKVLSAKDQEEKDLLDMHNVHLIRHSW